MTQPNPAGGRLLLALAPFFSLKQTLPARSIQALLLVAEYPGESVSEHARRAGISTSSMCRILLDLGPRDRKMQKGFGLIFNRDNPENLSHKQYFLTSDGEAFLARVLRNLEGNNGKSAKARRVENRLAG